MKVARPPYRIETLLGQLQTGAPAAALPRATAPVHEDPRLDEILLTLQDVKRMLDPTYREASNVVEAYRSEIAEVFRLRVELESMRAAIAATKSEIASIRRSDREGRGMRRAAGELDAVVSDTERATTAIIAIAEEIGEEAEALRGIAGALADERVEAILSLVTRVYESCNFQDLAGQRVTKIVGVLKFLEERLDAMIGVWSGLDVLRDLMDHPAAQPQRPAARPAESALLNGPRLDGDDGHISQSDIDALFA
ncbi:chemotaxis protein [Chelatococcus sp. SYSU_G07232]|uniref:Chemotaxis protein n=1 Tax=Chelatococcus albus TaxID=3047466 RepID=A0ABT7AEV6_9HYPH|nr:chemotaxis protein [Chelatococcus sp. SYSU_G07232]MDJ1157908.1 chemotaxis protein [Chelatococcus sp. SYSU_G07232]